MNARLPNNAAATCALRALRDGRTKISGGSVVRSTLVVLQIACTFASIIGCGLLLRSVLAYSTTDLGYRTDRLVGIVGTPIDITRYPTAARQVAFFSRSADRLAAIPGVDSAGATTAVPLLGSFGDRLIQFAGQSSPIDASDDYVSPSFFASPRGNKPCPTIPSPRSYRFHHASPQHRGPRAHTHGFSERSQ